MDIYDNFPLYHNKATPAPIRLLRLHAAEHHHEEIRCDLSVTDLGYAEPFEALSYTWGSEKNPATIKIEGHDQSVRQNLATALRHLRLSDRSRLLWADAVCINQSNDAEKSLQVEQMRRVYTGPRTQRVLVWLGAGKTAHAAPGFLDKLEKAQERAAENNRTMIKEFFPGTSDTALPEAMAQLMQRVNDSSMTIKDFAETAASPTERAFLEHVAQGTVPLQEEDPLSPLIYGYDSEWDACKDLFSCQWWQRTWVLQEVIHAKEVLVHIGTLEARPLDGLCRAAGQYRTLLNLRLAFRGSAPPPPPPATAFSFEIWLRASGTVETAASNILMMRAKYARVGEAAAPRLPDLLYQLRKQEASLDLDKIYGLLGMSTNEYGIKPDYAMSKRALYTDVARHMLAKMPFSALLWVESPDREVTSAGLPSWVVDHTTNQSHKAMAMAQQWSVFSANKDFPALELEGSQEPHLAKSLEATTFVVRAIRIGSVTEVRDDQITADKEIESKDLVRLFGYKSADRSSPIDKANGTRGSFRNSNWGPCKAAIGDIIVIAAGSTVPLMLRQAGEEGEYLFVGGCWLIDSEIRDLFKVEDDPAFSPIMFGSACVGVVASQVELFYIR